MDATANRNPETKQEKIRRLQHVFIESASNDVGALGADLDMAGADFHGSEQGERLRKVAHDLRGCGAAYGFMALGEAAGCLEDSYRSEDSPENLKPLVEKLEDAIGRAKAALEQAVASSTR
jgi:HPt (histidine-containing phosphotransfer) domain-containing protein